MVSRLPGQPRPCVISASRPVTKKGLRTRAGPHGKTASKVNQGNRSALGCDKPVFPMGQTRPAPDQNRQTSGTTNVATSPNMISSGSPSFQ
jgi:hypothetical protein